MQTLVLQTQIIFLDVSIPASIKFMTIICPYFVMKNFHSFQSSFFFTIHILKEIKNFGYIGSWLYRFRSDAEVVPFHWSPHHIPLEWPVWHCLIECNFHLYHGFLHVHFWTHLFSMKAIINDTSVHSSLF